jgi:DNA-binding Xre family transcriptional regulator
MIKIRIDELATARGMTYRQLAQQSGLSESHLRRLRQGKVRFVRFTTLQRLVRALGVENMNDLLQLDLKHELKEHYTIPEVAKRFRVPMSTILDEIGRGELRGTMEQGYFTISRHAVADYVRRHTVPAPQPDAGDR